MIPTRRDLQFDLPAMRVRNWHGRSRSVTQLFNALSLFFPSGERFFIQSVRYYRDQLDDETLARSVKAFIGQEAMHGREHGDYNALMAIQGLPAERLENLVQNILHTIQTWTPKRWQLSATIALEHFTAILADRLLCDPRMLDGCEPEYRRIWLWHALEETEHKAVAYDVWLKIQRRGMMEYLHRSAGMVVTTVPFLLLVAAYTVILIESDASMNVRSPDPLREYGELLTFLLGENGLVSKRFVDWLTYFRPRFHPWQHNNRKLLQRLAEVTRSDGAAQEASRLAA